MALPIIAAIARIGISKAIKKFGKKAVEKAKAAEKKVSGAVGKTPSGAKNRAKNDPRGNKPTASAVRSGRKRIGAGVATAATAVGVPKVGGALSDSIASDYKKPPTPAKKSTGNFKAQDKATVPTGVNLRKEAESAARMDNRQGVKSSTTAQKSQITKSATDVSKPPKQAKAKQPMPKKKTFRDFKTPASAKKAGFKSYMGKDGKEKAAVFKTELKGKTLNKFLNARNQSDKGVPKIKKPSIKKPKGFNMGGMATPDPSGMDAATMQAMMKKKKRKPMMPAQQAMAGGASVPMMREGGPVRGAGMAKKGVRACKMR
tara:strand:- start:587 stop:1534 length:948 start_codon:yes stop_codon:yes gene_type:complete